jgi:hypothetical protein
LEIDITTTILIENRNHSIINWVNMGRGGALLGRSDSVDVPRGKRVGGYLRQGQELVAIDRTGAILEIELLVHF